MAEDEAGPAKGTAPVPDTLSVTIPIKKRGVDWETRQRRARSNVPGRRANIPEPVRPGETMFRIVPDNKTIRKWWRGRGHKISDRGPIPGEVRDAFAQFLATNGNAGWTVKVISLQPPGATVSSGFFQVRQGKTLMEQTTDEFYVKRAMGEELYDLLTLVKGRKKK